ncbi:serine phosphatase RsbU (regulator of sigma subunit) [Glaciihabitans tibetensis]|uniref:Serine phosphatase RsbU (Regulator of sigma subunit) n=1 Tax=Glaciihabitans tibetensis TaxID=1266600 RepID=A0A2T0VDA1_9MICO|nr:SpoIIE family protein phosphatase [Glaciihabitans tibetensis]PRY68139.1 serine phosphatase RsbU (regulator of sigma subunit) [Glaciihabitans tibetensis]
MTEKAYRVLVVDDDEDLAQYARTILERRAGCVVRSVGDAQSAIEAAKDFRPDVVVTDIEMPGMTGLELVAAIRDTFPTLPFIVMTGHVSAEYAIRALRGQADEFFTKPVVSAELVAAVNRLAAQWRLRTEEAEEAERAAEVQRRLLPQRAVDLEGYDLAGGSASSRVVGGDFFDWYAVDDGMVITLADVMGKGVGAAIIAATVRAVLRAGARENDLGAVLGTAAEVLAMDLEHAGSFVTLFHCRLVTANGQLRYADAGHGLSLVARADGSVKRLSTSSFPLGTGLDDSWREHSLTLESGDTLVSMSDGVLDLWDGSLAGLDEVEKMARAASCSQDIVDELLALASVGAPDDVTVVALRRT